MVDPVTALSTLLLVAAVAGSVLPLVPAGVTALAGVYLHHFLGPSEAGGAIDPLLLAGFTLVGVTTALVEHFGGAIAAKAGGAETGTVLLAGVASLLLFLFLGPLGAILGLVGVVAAAELRAGKEPREAAVASAWTVAGLLASAVAQFLLTLSMLVGFVAFVLVPG
ncbi:DUF456 family protein [Halorarum salinum]|uniref:DUF456 family protein n=1 Tax=Halorarum salinum TaxID=2743089 RepID=A0A7D5LBB5_9EURY|nr:DUF456 family protein [Halobaculum salinum]QLG62713.1 DUF456 family protein [Halobaculum salinum]